MRDALIRKLVCALDPADNRFGCLWRILVIKDQDVVHEEHEECVPSFRIEETGLFFAGFYP